MKLTIIALALATFLNAGTVYFSPTGKTFHVKRECLALARSKEVLHSEDSAAAAHGLKPCGICQRKAKAKSVRNGWAK